MTPPIPPRAEKPRRPELQRTGSTREAFDHAAQEGEKRNSIMRARLDSQGSTRGAFFQSPTKNQEGRRKKRSPKKKESPDPQKRLSSNAMAVGDMASLAMAGLDDDELGLPFGNMEKSPKQALRKGQQQQPTATTATAATGANHRPPPLPHPLSSLSRSAESPQNDDIEAPKGVTFSSVMHETINNNRPASPTTMSYLPPTTTAGLANNKLPNFSERSLDLHAVMGPGGMPPPPGNNVPRFESLTLSETSFDANQDSWLASLRGTDIPLEEFVGNNMRDGFRASLHGSNIPLDSSAHSSSEGMQPQREGGASYPGWYPGGPAQPQPYPQPLQTPQQPPMTRQQDIAQFSSMIQADYGATHPPSFPESPDKLSSHQEEEEEPSFSFDDNVHNETFTERVRHFLDPTAWLLSDVPYDEDGTPLFDEHHGWTLPGLVRHFLYNPEFPEFTSLQQFSWAVIIGIVMGIYTALWKFIIEGCVDFVWQTIPGTLRRWGFFTDLDGAFPLPNYMWICPAIFGGVLSYIFVILPKKIPGQNEWIQSLHSRGVQDHETFWPLFILSTLGMSSGLSLGPELPLVLTAGMVGSWLGVVSKQSMLQARVMNLTAASAAVGGFFGFPMAGAMFVLEIPHRMGLQYFEALSPATIASIVAVLVNRMIVNNDVTGYYNYPFLTATLPSHIFWTAVVYGLVGSGLGIGYAEGVMYLKHVVHDLFSTHHHHPHDNSHEKEEGDDAKADMNGEESKKNSLFDKNGIREETIPLVGHTGMKTEKQEHRTNDVFERLGSFSKKVLSFGISNEPTRAAVAGTLAGLVVGITIMFVPHVAFWGEAQLQSLIDKGRTPLPIFGEEEGYTEELAAYGYCLIDPNDPAAVAAGFSIGCAALITTAKIFVTGLSLGTGIIGGHFWGPLFTGCSASHLLTDVCLWMQRTVGFGQSLATYPCVSILCMMGSTHVVTFRAHMAIMLILTLTISAFDLGESDNTGYTAGDYSAVFPLLVVSVFVSLMVSRGTVFYKAQRSRGDIMALPQVLCEPGKAGAPVIMDFDAHHYDDFDSFTSSQEEEEYYEEDESLSSSQERRKLDMDLNPEDIEKEFEDRREAIIARSSGSMDDDKKDDIEKELEYRREAVISRSDGDLEEHGKGMASSQMPIPVADVPPEKKIPLPVPEPAMTDGRSKSVVVQHDEHPLIGKSVRSAEEFDLPSQRLEELLSKPLEPRFRPRSGRHRRIHSAPDGGISAPDQALPLHSSSHGKKGHRRTGSVGGEALRERSNSAASSRAATPTRQVTAYGEVSEFQPSLMDQARSRASSMHTRNPSLPRMGRHSRQNSNASAASAGTLPTFTDVSGALSSDDVERTFSAAATSLNRSIWS